ncbi:hypothetical protein CPB83DRAFT_578163 [Crepidotus variabilis]|uniref:NAD-dependent epimerase/dehydratase domain-containing protein n=1 Tax=Crepidotus variabilis TaxID=179855 RepID=A0A9P6JL47_9AGAR|nr:hypothetical protein CPB83DRAFT_578163 [Crepidotus variabilis]
MTIATVFRNIMKIAITGCNGTVGRRVVKLALERGNEVLGIDLIEIDQAGAGQLYTFARADLTDFDLVLKLIAGCEAVIHLAGLPNPIDYKVATHNLNVVLSWNVLRACAELGIKRVAQASSVNVVNLTYSATNHFKYFPLDEDHPCETDEPYGLSKQICELQGVTIVRRYPSLRVASLRLHWSVASRAVAATEVEKRATDLWGYVQEDSAADAFLLALEDNSRWSGHESFFITAPRTAFDDETESLLRRFWPNVAIRESFVGTKGLFDCSKAERLLGWKHKD